MTNVIYLITLSISFICSLIGFRLHKPHLQLFSIFLGLTAFTEGFANLASGPFRWKTNWPIYNSFMLPEYCIYTLYFKAIIRSCRVKKLLTFFLILIPIIWVITNFWLLKITVWNSYMILFGDLITIIMCACFLYELVISDEDVDLKTSAEFWIASSTLMYCCCELPITGRFNFLDTHDVETAARLLIALQVLNIIMYLTILYAYLCRRLINITRS